MFFDHIHKVTVVGAQKSGVAAAELLRSRNVSVRLTECRQKCNCDENIVLQLESLDIQTEYGGHGRAELEASELVVVSPGVPFYSEVLQWARDKGIPILTEVELAFQLCSRPVIGVTGSNGKTTVVTLVHDVLQRAGYRSALCGNIGVPFSKVVLLDKDLDFYVVELSSFQTEAFLDSRSRPEFIKGFVPHIGVVLNFSQNHLDRHRDLEDYLRAKKRIFLNQVSGDYAVLNAQDPYVQQFAQGLKADIRYFMSDANLRNPNYSAVMAVAEILGISSEVCQDVFLSFSGVRHRMQQVAVIGGVHFINDSKSTTTEASRWALTALDQPVHWICGGRDKQLDFRMLRDTVREKVKRIYAIGEAVDKIQAAFADIVPVETVADFEDAVRQSYDQAVSGEAVLLSPMCASFDMFRNFEHRGDVFCQVVETLASSERIVIS